MMIFWLTIKKTIIKILIYIIIKKRTLKFIPFQKATDIDADVNQTYIVRPGLGYDEHYIKNQQMFFIPNTNIAVFDQMPLSELPNAIKTKGYYICKHFFMKDIIELAQNLHQLELKHQWENMKKYYQDMFFKQQLKNELSTIQPKIQT